MIALRHTTLGRTALDAWSARRRETKLTSNNTYERKIAMPRRDSNSLFQRARGHIPTPLTAQPLDMPLHQITITNTLWDLWIYNYWVIRNDCRCFNNLPPRSPDATPCDFFLWGYVKDQVYVPPLPASIPELEVRIRTAIETFAADMLQTVWNELDCRVDVCRITKGAHIEHL